MIGGLIQADEDSSSGDDGSDVSEVVVVVVVVVVVGGRIKNPIAQHRKARNHKGPRLGP